MDKDLLRLPRC